MAFIDRDDAGKQLADRLAGYGWNDPVVYALPRGGVVLGAHIARKLNAPLDLVITRKIGHPDHPEYAIAAVAEDGSSIADEVQVAVIDADWYAQEVLNQRNEARRRREEYQEGRMPRSAEGADAIIVDDGVATGLTILAAIEEVRAMNPARIVVAVPVAPPDVAAHIAGKVDELVALQVPEVFAGAVGSYYQDFGQVGDDEVKTLLGSLSG